MKALYLEPDEEITSVVDRLKEIDDDDIAIVVPKRAGILQSIVNLKLLRFQGEQLKKQLSIVTSDKTGRNLASAVGLTVYQKLPGGEKVKEAAVKEPSEEPSEEPVPINFRKRRRPDDETTPTWQISKGRPAKLTTQAVPDEPAAEPLATSTAKTSAEPAPEPKFVPAPPKVEREDPKPPRKRPAMPAISLPKLPKLTLPKFSGKRRWPIIAGVIVAVLLTGSGVAAAVLPQAEIVITPQTNPFSADVPVTFSTRATSVDLAGKVLPSKTIEIERPATVNVKATGSKASGGKATGTIAVVNTLAKAQPLVGRTRFQSPDGKIYRTQAAVTVPAGGQINVSVTADDGGEAGNLAAGTKLSIPGLRGEGVYGQADQAIVGGTDSATPEVSAADADRGRILLAAKAAKDGMDEAKSKVPVGSKLNDQMVTTNASSVNVTPPVGAQTAEFAISGTVKVVYFTYVEADLQKLIDQETRPKIPAGDDLVAESTQQTFSATQPSSDKLTGVLKLNSSTTKELSRDQLRKDLAGKNAAEAEAYLKETGKVSNALVKLSPFWVKSVPKSAKKVKIRYVGATPTTPSPSVKPGAPQASSVPTI